MGIKKQFRRESENMFWVILGVICFAVSYRCFLVPAGLYSGGFTGIAQLIKFFLEEAVRLNIPVNMDLTGVIFWCINIPLFVVGYKSIGKKFLIRTLIAVGIQSILLTFIPAPSEPLLHDMLLNCVFGGILSGFGVGITLRAGGSGGGLDIVGMYCVKEKPAFGVGKVSILINFFIYSIAAYRNNLSVAAYSMVFCLASGIMVDRVHDQNINLTALIVTQKDGMGERINREIFRGVTSWKGWGEYSHKEEYIHMVVINKYEWPSLKRLIHQEDPDAFVQIILPDRIVGNFEKRLEVQ